MKEGVVESPSQILEKVHTEVQGDQDRGDQDGAKEEMKLAVFEDTLGMTREELVMDREVYARKEHEDDMFGGREIDGQGPQVNGLPVGELDGSQKGELDLPGVGQVMHEHPADVRAASRRMLRPLLDNLRGLSGYVRSVLSSFLQDP